ncbi:neuritin-like protein [Dromiciops gliroides]|uniref:neuritin-like protein n=1 Tax=Dromiciops gliroides TaxID=33562 RepID=UPI001CC55249|nr:neuritin-like protein [Dromiciops gliroides]
MSSCCRRRRSCWRPLPFPGFLLLQLILAPGPGMAATSNRCDTIYKGFADCLIKLGNSMVQSGQPDKGASLTPPELKSICRSWENFQTCANGVLANCPQEATAIWESLTEESRKVQYPGNLHDLCSSQPFPPSNVRGVPSEETNQETLQGSPAPGSPAPAPVLLAAALALACILGPLA